MTRGILRELQATTQSLRKPTPKEREAIFRKLGQSGRAGMSESIVSQETAIAIDTVR